VQRRIERGTTPALLALEGFCASLEVVDAAALDLGDIAGLLSDRGEVCRSRNGGGGCGSDSGFGG
jgi:hypothetical protein